MIILLTILMLGCANNKALYLISRTKNPNATEVSVMEGVSYNSNLDLGGASLFEFQNDIFCALKEPRIYACFNRGNILFISSYDGPSQTFFYGILSDKEKLILSNRDGEYFYIFTTSNVYIGQRSQRRINLSKSSGLRIDVASLISTKISNYFYILFFKYNIGIFDQTMCVQGVAFNRNGDRDYNLIGPEIIIASFDPDRQSKYIGLDFDNTLLVTYPLQNFEKIQDIDYSLIDKDANGHLTSIIETGKLNLRNKREIERDEEQDQSLVKYDINKFLLTYTGDDEIKLRKIYIRGFRVNNYVIAQTTVIPTTDEMRLTSYLNSQEYFPETYYIEEAEAFVTFFYHQVVIEPNPIYDIAMRFYKVKDNTIFFLTDTMTLKNNIFPQSSDITTYIDRFGSNPKISFIYNAKQENNITILDTQISYSTIPSSRNQDIGDLRVIFDTKITFAEQVTTTTAQDTTTTTTITTTELKPTEVTSGSSNNVGIYAGTTLGTAGFLGLAYLVFKKIRNGFFYNKSDSTLSLGTLDTSTDDNNNPNNLPEHEYEEIQDNQSDRVTLTTNPMYKSSESEV